MGLFQNEAKVDVTMKDVSKTIQYKYRHLDRLPVRNVHVILSYCNCIPRSSCSRAAEEEAFYHKTRFYAVLWQRNTRRDTRHETMSKDWDLGLTRKFEGHFSPQERGARTALNFLAVCSHELRVEATAHSITKFRKNVFFVQEAGCDFKNISMMESILSTSIAFILFQLRLILDTTQEGV